MITTGAEVDTLEESKEGGVRFRLNPACLLTIAICWSYVINRTALPLADIFLLPLLFALCALFHTLFAETRFSLSLGKRDAWVFGGFLGLNLLVHWPALTYSLGGDELYHAERASVVVASMRDHIARWPAMDLTAYRSSIWYRFDLRHMPIVDLWRTVSFGILLIAGVAYALWRALLRRRKGFPPLAAVVLVFLGCIAVRYLVSAPAENHPPLRLLPLFLSSTVFGLNNFAFRLPGILVVALVSWATFRFLNTDRRARPLVWKLLLSAGTGFLPITFYVAEAVEPSVYGYLGYALFMIFAVRFLRLRNESDLVKIGIIVAVASLMRQPTIALWLPTAVLYVFHAGRSLLRSQNILLGIKIFSPAVIVLPYLWSAHVLGHVAVANEGSTISKLIASVVTGAGPVSILNTTTLPWSMLFVALFPFVIRSATVSELGLFLIFIPAYAVYYVIWSYLWGLGRYQAEYVAPFFVLLLILLAHTRSLVGRRFTMLLLPVACITTIELDTNLSLDTGYRDWPKMRVTSSANFPYREALGTLKRLENGGNFVIIGGSPRYGDMTVWLAGFNFAETDSWRSHRNDFEHWIAPEKTSQELYDYLFNRGITHILVQSGTRRELQHRPAPVQRIATLLETVPLERRTLFYKVRDFSGEHGGVLSLYALKQQSSSEATRERKASGESPPAPKTR